jgi:hypothetical protein
MGNPEDKSLLTPNDYADAIHAQSACNLSGIVFSFARVMQRICNEANAGGHGTDWKNNHAISRLYAEQIAHLSGSGQPEGGPNAYHKAYAECEARSKQPAQV